MMARPSTWTEDEIKQARQMRESGATYAAIAAVLGKSRKNITNRLQADDQMPNDRRLRIQLRACPKCRYHSSRVLYTSRTSDGLTLRHCLCESCGHKFFTAQEPEYLVPNDRVRWTPTGGDSRIRLVDAERAEKGEANG
jgi:DNA-directed RNA polymerase subunit M/transcription elongation factor TFIIS